MGKMQRTNLAWDKYSGCLIDVILESNFMKRAAEKPMASPKTADESHVTTRSSHLLQSAKIAKEIAEELGLNADFIYIAMLMHDAGHPFSAHEGEEIFNDMGDIYNIPYFHHNAKSIEIILNEDICGKAISRIPGIENNPKLKKQLEEEFYYFLDVVISHDGEATREDMMKPETYYETIQEAVKAKIKSANNENDYKFIAQTPEGKIAKFADVIAYLSTDMQDAFRFGIIKDFSDNYLELFGEMFSTEKLETKKEKIDFGRKFVEKIKEQNLRDKREIVVDFLNTKDNDMQETINSIHKKIQEAGLYIYNDCDTRKIQKIIEEGKENFIKSKLDKFFSETGKDASERERKALEKRIRSKTKKGLVLEEDEQKFLDILNRTNVDANEIEMFTTKMLRVRSNVVREVTNRIKDFFINDLISNSQDKDSLQFDNGDKEKDVWKMFFRAKKSNYNEYVQYTNWDYQTKELPEAARILVEKSAASLIKSGAIRNKFNDPRVRGYINDEDALKYMKTQYRPEKQYESYRKKHGIGNIKAFAKTSNKRFLGKKQYELMSLWHKMYEYLQDEEEVFAMKYENVFNAIKTRVRRKIETALSEEHSVKKQHLYRKEVQKQVDGYREEIISKYGTTKITGQQKDEFIDQKIQEELEKMEEKMAYQIASDYLAGMTDRSFTSVALKTGALSQNVLKNARRGTVLSSNVGNIINKMNQEEKNTKKSVEER